MGGFLDCNINEGATFHAVAARGTINLINAIEISIDLKFNKSNIVFDYICFDID